MPQAEIIICPLADGGEGTVKTVIEALSGEVISCQVTDPLGNKISSYFGFVSQSPPRQLKPLGIIEMAAASGLHLVPPKKRNPLITTTFGTGELIKAALAKGCQRIIVGIGGSATCDGGMGALQALGVRFLDKKGEELGFGGGELTKLAKIDPSLIDKRLEGVDFLIASDVNNPLIGPQGAAQVYASQKGADPQGVALLEEGLRHFAQLIKRDFGKDILSLPGGGAAGGLGAGLLAFLNAKITLGSDLVIDLVGFKDYLKKADLVITGEGKFDTQTSFGKIPFRVIKLAKGFNLPVLVVAGIIDFPEKDLSLLGVRKAYSAIDYTTSLKESIKNASFFLEMMGKRIGKDLRTIL